MPKNSRISVWIETDRIEQMKREAERCNLTFSDLVRIKIEKTPTPKEIEIVARKLVFGKTGARKPLVVFSAPYLQQWINCHPLNNNPNAYLWHNPQYKEKTEEENKTIENKKCSEEEGCISGVSPNGEFKICFSGDGSKENQLCWVGIKYFQVSKEDGTKQGA